MFAAFFRKIESAAPVGTRPSCVPEDAIITSSAACEAMPMPPARIVAILPTLSVTLEEERMGPALIPPVPDVAPIAPPTTNAFAEVSVSRRDSSTVGVIGLLLTETS